jgi:hypothetical protein
MVVCLVLFGVVGQEPADGKRYGHADQHSHAEQVCSDRHLQGDHAGTD